MFLSLSLKGIVKLVLTKMGNWRINLGKWREGGNTWKPCELPWMVNAGEREHR